MRNITSCEKSPWKHLGRELISPLSMEMTSTTYHSDVFTAIAEVTYIPNMLLGWHCFFFICFFPHKAQMGLCNQHYAAAAAAAHTAWHV